MQREVQQAASLLMETEEGMRALLERAPHLDEAGMFQGTPWQEPLRLMPRLVAGGLLGEPPHPVMEALNELRMLAIARGEAHRPDISEADAVRFLERIIALNLDFVFPRETEASRTRNAQRFQQASRLFHLILEELPQADFLHLVVQEIEEICLQRRIWTGPVRNMIRLASRLPGASDSTDERLHRYVEAVLGPSPMSQRFRDTGEYREALKNVDDAALQEEIQRMAASLRRTGLACPQHAVLLRHLNRKRPELIGEALGLEGRGPDELKHNLALVQDLITVALHPGTGQTAYGLARLLERGLLGTPDIDTGLRRMAELHLRPDVEQQLLESRATPDGVSANAILVSGAVRVLGQPLGVGQGRNPTCQAARGISLWAQHRPGYLLEVLMAAARDGDVHVYFGDEELHSKDLPHGVAWHIDPDLDPVSLVLVPHLDRLYDEMMRRVLHLGGDGHRWVNPGLYGRTVANGFSTCFDPVTWHVRGYGDFLRRFYATHHPDYRVHRLVYPNPVGILVTTAHADLLGLHAVNVQRVEPDPEDVVRVYFYNPNDEGRQDWGQDVKPSIHGHGEQEGESSLPFWQFASRLYAFHYNPFEQGDAFAVPAKELKKVEQLARESWGTSYQWDDVPL